MNIIVFNVQVLQEILRYLNEVEKQEFSASHPILWQKCTTVKFVKPVHLVGNSITAFQLHTLTVVRLKNQHYAPSFITHLVQHARYLRVVQIEERSFYSDAFKKKLQTWFPPTLRIAYYPYEEESSLPNIKDIVTPENVRIALESIKKQMKSRYVQEATYYQLRDKLEYKLPCHLNKHWRLSDYTLLKDTATDQRLTTTEANDLVNYFGNLLVNSICLIDDCYFVLTSNSVFIHHHPHIDDCAHHSTIAYQPKPVVYIRKNKKFAFDHHELSIRIGHLEILATGGFWARLEDRELTPFLGSSLICLPTSLVQDVVCQKSHEIYINSNPQDTLSTTRLLNQYLKKHSTLKWAFHSQGFYDSHFSPCNPLNFSSSNQFAAGASLLLKMYAHKMVYKKELKQVLKQLLKQLGKAQKVNDSDAQVMNLLKYTDSRYARNISLSPQETLA